MAKYADYVKDDLDTELEDAQQGEQARTEATIPERFKGKSLEQIIESYEHLERAYSQQGNVVGDLRRSVDTLLALKSQESSTEQSRPSKQTVTHDDLYEKPDEVIRTVVNEEVKGRLDALENQIAQTSTNTALSAFTQKYPEWQKDAASPEMLEWIKTSPYRVKQAIAADKGDLDAADELFGTYYDFRKANESKQKEQKRASTRKAVAAASLESAGSVAPEHVETYSRSFIVSQKTAAARGDYKARQWLEQHAAAIQDAYAERRVTD